MSGVVGSMYYSLYHKHRKWRAASLARESHKSDHLPRSIMNTRRECLRLSTLYTRNGGPSVDVRPRGLAVVSHAAGYHGNSRGASAVYSPHDSKLLETSRVSIRRNLQISTLSHGGAFRAWVTLLGMVPPPTTAAVCSTRRSHKCTGLPGLHSGTDFHHSPSPPRRRPPATLVLAQQLTIDMPRMANLPLAVMGSICRSCGCPAAILRSY